MGKASAVSSKNVTVDGISVEILRKRIKTLRLTVCVPDGKVRISAPLGMPEARILDFVQSKVNWIQRQQGRIREIPQIAPKEYVTGEALMLFGSPRILQIKEHAARNEVLLCEEKLLLSMRGESTPEQRERVINEWYRGLLKEKIGELLPKWEAITGLHPTEWNVKRMSTRWGTCNPRAGRIWFSLQLAQRPVDCLEYVILHELAHLQVPNHGKAFCAILDRYMPDWKSRKLRLTP